MCGITGIVDYSSSIDQKILQKSLKTIVHRGPDSEGFYFDKYVALGIRRLSIIDLTTGDQPISNENDLVTVVFNGEIYNFLSLKEKLIKGGHKFKTKSDTEVLVHLYEKYDEGMTKYLNGMFAFAIWDKKKSKLFLARDHTGIKPLYYLHQGDKLIFGSEVKTILTHGIPSINEKSLVLYSYLGYIPGQESIFQNIKKLKPGYNLTFSKKGLVIKPYFQIRENKDQKLPNLEDLFEDSIKLQSFADVPLGVLLSGGLDSSLITFYLTKLQRKVKSFSISFKEESFDEGSFAKKVSRYLGTIHYQEDFSVMDVKKDFKLVTDKLDEPLADPSLFPTYKVCALARKYVKVALSGDGGDELFGGYPTYQGHLLADKLPIFPNNLTNFLPKLTKLLLPKSDKNYPVSEVLASFLLGLSKKPIARHFFWMSLVPLGQKKLLEINLEKWFKKEFPDYKASYLNSVQTAQSVDFLTYLTDDLLVKVDRASMINSLEVRVPILDPRIIEYAQSRNIEHDNLISTKKLLRDLLRDRLPKEIVQRKKKGFGIPLAKWLRKDLKDLGEGYLRNRKLFNYFEKDEIDKLWIDHQNMKENNSKALWMLIIFSAWLNKWGKI